MTPGTRIFTGGGLMGAVILGVFVLFGTALFLNWLQDTPPASREFAIDHTYNTAGHER